MGDEDDGDGVVGGRESWSTWSMFVVSIATALERLPF